ncbi:MAG: glycosyltransferase [Actinomycetota bacterium]|nr:glycosyltransferase [Actinomycetota bacterium]
MIPEVTAIVPTHNRRDMLITTLRSVLWQRDVSLEVVVVDDGSRDDTAAVVSKVGDPRVRLLRHDTPRGVSVARNRGAAEARGQWLAFADDDDLWAPDKLARQLAVARTTGRTWAYGGAVHVNAALRVMTAKEAPAPDRLVATLPRWSLMPGGSSNVIVQADVFAATGGWDPTLINLADWDMWARLAQQGHPACVNAPLVGYRIHVGNASADTALVLREARMIDGRYGARLDYGQLHHYLAWVHLRSARRRPALGHLARAAARGQIRGVAGTLALLARQRMGHHAPALRPRPSGIHKTWLAEAEKWIAPLREASFEAA